jgi:hypothetical protein
MIKAADARVRELQFLARLDREGAIELQALGSDLLDKAMIAELIHQGYLNGIGTVSWTYRTELQYFHVARPENNDLFGYEPWHWCFAPASSEPGGAWR